VLSLVYRVDAMGTNDGTWKYTSLLICGVVETDVAIIVSCAPGFANFTRVYISELSIIKPLLSTFGRNSSGVSDLANKPSMNSKKDPSRPQMEKGARKRENHEFDVLSDTFESASSNERGEGEDIVYYGPGTYASGNNPFQTSADELVVQQPGEH
jgi:hypothetical protein